MAVAESRPGDLAGRAVGTVPPLNALKKAAFRLKRYQRAAARKIEAAKVKAGLAKDAPFPKGFKLQKSNRLKHALGKVAAVQAKVARVRLTWLHTLSTRLADDYAVFCLEDLKIAAMTASAKGTKDEPGRQVSQKSGLNQSILDLGPVCHLPRLQAGVARRTDRLGAAALHQPEVLALWPYASRQPGP